jgi:hypothetical protein
LSRLRTLIAARTGSGLVAALGGGCGAGKLFFPSGFAAGSDGAIYVSNCSIAPATGMGPQLCPTGGQVVRIR